MGLWVVRPEDQVAARRAERAEIRALPDHSQSCVCYVYTVPLSPVRTSSANAGYERTRLKKTVRIGASLSDAGGRDMPCREDRFSAIMGGRLCLFERLHSHRSVIATHAGASDAHSPHGWRVAVCPRRSVGRGRAPYDAARLLLQLRGLRTLIVHRGV